jgi:hypothetical protein
MATEYSAGTYDYKVCIICTDGGVTTAVEVSTPHPNYTNSTGGTVVQTQMVEIGGLNGLNS